MFKATQESPGDFTAQGLHKLRDPALLQGSNLAADTGSTPAAPHPYAHLRLTAEKFELECVKGKML